MGWLSFLSRKSPAAHKPGDLKAQAYDETVAANPPIRGTYPVAGNGPSILQKFQKSHAQADFNDNSAPPPVVPRILERPNTAPSPQFSQESARPKSRSGTPTILLRDPPKKRHGPYRLPSKLPTDGTDNIGTNKSIHSAPSPSFTHDRNRNSSIFSADSGSTRRFVDLLDAQSFIKPSDFYGRVKATGAKDYDEEVADRNIGANGSDLNSVHAQDFYSKNLASDVRYNGREDNRPLSPSKRHSMGSSLRSRATDSDLLSSLPKMPILQAPQEDQDETQLTSDRKVSHRKSLHSYIPSADRPNSASTKKVKDAEFTSFSDFLREKARAAAKERDSDANARLESKSIPSLRKAKRMTAKEETPCIESLPYCTPTKPKQSLQVQANPQTPTRDDSRRRTMSHMSSLTTVKSTLPPRRDSLHNFQSISRQDPTPDISSATLEELLLMRKSRNPSIQHSENLADFDGSFSELPQLRPTGTPQLKSTPSRLSSREGLNYDGNRSAISVSRKSIKRPELEDIFPERGSSIRRWSLTSETAGSTLSSNPFRPQSGHTTNTSIDLTPRIPSSKPLESKYAPSISEDNHATLENRMETESYDAFYQEVDPDMLVGSLINPGREEHSGGFVVEEDALSIDSFDAPQRSTGEFEKDLLFEGYGLEGSQLPGLPGLFDAATETPEPEPTMSRRTKRLSASKGSFHLTAFSPSVDDMHRFAAKPQYSTRSLPYASRSRSSHLRMPAIQYSDSEEDENSELGYESEEELNFDIPKARSNTSRSRYDSHSSSRGRYEPSEAYFGEEDLDMDFPNAAQLAQLRREAKAKQRVAKGKGKARDIGVPRIGLDDPSSYADIDS